MADVRMMPDFEDEYGVGNSTNENISKNSTTIPSGYTPLVVQPYIQAIIILFYGWIIFFAIIGNGVVLGIVLRVRRMRTVINFFLASLAFGDLLMAIMCIPFTFVANLVLNYWPFGDVLCPIVTYLQLVTVFVSSYTLIAISIDRFIAIIMPLRPKTSKRTCVMTILLIWSISCVIPIPTAVTARTHKYVDYPSAPLFCEEKWRNPESKKSYTIALMLLQYFIPLGLMLLTYIWIIVALWIKKPPGEAQSERDQRINNLKRRITKMMIILVIIFALCWLPIHIITIVGDANPSIYNQKYMNIVWTATHWLAMSNCMYNPFIYCWMNKKFRSGFIKVFKMCTCARLISQEDMELRRIRRNDTVTTSILSAAGHHHRRNGNCDHSCFETGESL